MLRRLLLGFYYGILDDRPPSLDLSSLKRGQRGRRLLVGRWNFLPQVREPTLNRRIGQRINDGAVELRDDWPRRSPGRPHGGPDGDMETRQAGFIDRRNFRCGGEPLVSRDGISLDLAAPHMRQGVWRLIEHQVDVATHQVVHGRGCAAVLSDLEGRPAGTLKIEAADM